MIDKPHIFLGSNITALHKAQDMSAFLFEKLEVKLKNIDKSKIRGEYKVNVQIYTPFNEVPHVHP